MHRPYEVVFKPQHCDNPLYPASADELIAAIDEVALSNDGVPQYMWVVPNGPHTAVLFVGVAGVRGVGSLAYASETEDLHSRGGSRSDRTVFYLDFGEPRYFPQDSMIDLDDLRTAVRYFYDTIGERPNNIEWQEWSDTEADEVDWPCPDPWWV
ncbi:hypothetical protein LTV02_07180 [Nocardia yamanashiensis]|uniref:Imm1 family immunity protein n=1 Tax=Nocardia yamanashiensis TaxID=209247 RepID=UPI001E4FCC16|nr:Imm1 family immunity protein [Nocardia yamanashiensis]UGT43166.1 hypothetical protein LTV02_07180 [Nocardia yamanashiensis]